MYHFILDNKDTFLLSIFICVPFLMVTFFITARKIYLRNNFCCYLVKSERKYILRSDFRFVQDNKERKTLFSKSRQQKRAKTIVLALSSNLYCYLKCLIRCSLLKIFVIRIPKLSLMTTTSPSAINLPFT